MRRWLLLLMASTGLAGVRGALADTIRESSSGQFGGSFGSPTSLQGPSSTILADLDQYYSGQAADYFNVASPYTGFTLVLTASRVGVAKSRNPYPLDYIPSASRSGASAAEGGSTPVRYSLPTYGGIAAITKVGAAASASSEGGSVLVNPLTLTASADSASYTIPFSTLDPVITFYDDAGDTIDTVEITEGNSITISGLFAPAAADLNFSVASPFDYTVQLDPVPTSTDVPEPATAALLGLGAAGAALARRRRRMI